MCLVSCGGGGGSSTPPPPAQDFALAVSPASLSLQQLGSGQTLTISVVPVNGFAGSVGVTFPNLPAGFSVSAGSAPGPPYYASPTSPLSVGIGASKAAAVGTGTLTVQATSGTLSHSMTVNTTVTAAIDFQVNVSPATVTIGPNGQASAQVTLVPGANFGTSSVLLNIPSALVGSSGVSVSLGAQSLTAAQPQTTISFQSGFVVGSGSYPVPLIGALGGDVANVPLTLAVTSPAKACTSLSRSAVVPTDMDVTGVVYDSSRKLVFAGEQQTSTVKAFSSTTAQALASIPVPEPWGLDVTPDGSRVLVGTFTNSMYWIDPVGLEIAGKVHMPSPLEEGNLGLFAPPAQPVILANGKVLVSSGGYPPQEWDPATDAWSDPTPANFSASNSIMRRSADHSKVVVANFNGIAIFKSATNSYGPVQNLSAGAVALNSDGSRMAVLGASPSLPGGDQVTLYDQNFKVLATYQIDSSTLVATSASDVIFSRDGRYLYLQAGGYTTALNSSDLSFVGLASGQGTGRGDFATDIDESNMIFTSGSGALMFLDLGSPCAVGVNVPVNMTVTPPQGTLDAPAPVIVNAVQGITSQSQVYFGAAPGSAQATPGTNLVPSPPTSIQVTPPASQTAGPVSVTITNSDGSVGIAANAYSYGSSVYAVGTNSGPATGGTLVTLFGYGLAFDASQISVTVGGQAATVTRAFAAARISFPYPLDQVMFTTPPGSPGAADIVVTTPAGTATVAGGFHYLKSVQNYPGSGTLAQMVSDQERQRLYAADVGSTAVDVFDLAKQQFLTPIPVGKAPGALAITPDFNTLVVSNGGDSSVSIVDLTGANATKTVSLANVANLPTQCGQAVPYAVAATSSHKAVIALGCSQLETGEYIVLDLATLAIGCGSSKGCAAMLAAFSPDRTAGLMVSGSTDGNSIFVSNGSVYGLWNVPTDTFSSQATGGSELGTFWPSYTAAAADGTAFTLGFAAIEPTMDFYSMMQDVDYLQSGLNDTQSLPGEKLHPSGALLYYPENNGFSVYDVHSGHLRRRVALTQATSVAFDALAIDETGSKVFLLTTAGLAEVDMADVPLSIGHLQPAQGPASGGASVVVRGSGFVSGAQVLFNKTPANVAFVDGSTLKVTAPAVAAGAVRVTVINPDGSQYSLDNGFTAQ